MLDSGAHFHRCDFQVHSPRDRQWQGTRPSNEDERRAYAEAFVDECRRRGLDAVAITDHHDLVFFKYIKDAAQGNPIVFPGMELTLGVPCQALLILDADFTTDFLSQVPAALGIPATDPNAEMHGPTQAIADTPSIQNVAKLLDRQEFLRGRYILIPNVTETGHKTLIRAGFADHYKTAPCVAGYLDGAMPEGDRGRGWRAIVTGNDANYGNKRIGVFQTSDNRHANFAKLGEHTTWVKWAKPTAEALRQACLAAETRISQEAPELPGVTIRRLAVSNCRFLGPFDVDFNPQYNTLIGGRGTGKSTILEYLRWALCDQPPAVDENDELPNFQAKRDQLIKRTLVPFDGTVTVEFDLNGVAHAIRRRSQPRQLLLKIGDGEYQECDEQDVRELLPIQAYSQKQLSIVGVRADELLRLIRSPIKSALLDRERRENELRQQIQAAAEARQSRRQAERDLRRDETERTSTRAQLQKIRESLKGVSGDDQVVLDAHAGFDTESSVVTAMVRQLEGMRHASRGLADELAKQRRDDDVDRDDAIEATPNAEAINDMRQKFDKLHEAATQRADELLIVLEGGAEANSFSESVDRWREISERHERAYEQAKERASSQAATLETIRELEKRARELTDRISERRSVMARLGDPEAEFNERITTWIKLLHERADLLEAECQKLTDLSDRRIRATLARGADTSKIVDRLASMVTGTRIRREKIESLGRYVAKADDPVRAWCTIAEELNGLLKFAGHEIDEGDLPETPILNRIGFTAAELVKVAQKITLSEWIAALVAGVEDVPVFEYRQADADFIDFANASAGQQATALLHVLLNQSGPPLVIDQPEEDLDNEVVLEIVSAIWQAKSKRQLIVSSHNANVVVNGDADLVVVFGYRQAGDHSLGEITDAGAIDVQEIRDSITSIMEGGEKAFRLRKEKYGF